MPIPTTNILHSVFHIYVDSESNNSCAAFLVQKNQKQFLVTCRHIFGDNFTKDRIISYRQEYKWTDISVEVFYAENDVDIAVIKLPKNLKENILPVILNCDKVGLGQDAFFFGYPYGLPKFTPGGLPFVRKVTISGRNTDEDLWYLTGHNLPGFSGGPVGFFEYDKQDSSFHIMGVVSSYVKGKGLGDLQNLNTGIIECHDIKYALKLIEKIQF